MSGLARMFDITNGVVVLRLVCGLFFIPHNVGKFTRAGDAELLQGAKFNPPATWAQMTGPK